MTTATGTKYNFTPHKFSARPMSLFNKFKSLLGKKQPREDEIARSLQLANAVLLVEISHADFDVSADEIAAMAARLAQRHRLDTEDAHGLLSEARAEHRQSVSLHDYLTLINDKFNQAQKVQLVEDLWDIAYADNHLDCYEEHRIRKIAELLYVSHTHFIRGKHRAQKT